MTDDTKGRGFEKIAPGGFEQAPFIYFDGISTYGTNKGAIHVELSAGIILPEETGTRVDVLITAHLRCSPAAAVALRDAIDRALEILRTLPSADISQSAKPN